MTSWRRVQSPIDQLRLRFAFAEYDSISGAYVAQKALSNLTILSSKLVIVVDKSQESALKSYEDAVKERERENGNVGELQKVIKETRKDVEEALRRWTHRDDKDVCTPHRYTIDIRMWRFAFAFAFVDLLNG